MDLSGYNETVRGAREWGRGPSLARVTDVHTLYCVVAAPSGNHLVQLNGRHLVREGGSRRGAVPVTLRLIYGDRLRS